MKTPMQELIEYIEEFTPKNKTTSGIWSKAKSLIEKEKEQITTAFNVGFKDSGLSFLNGKKYFDSTFGDNHEAGI